MPTIAIPGAGAMGAAIGAMLSRHGATVLTLAGRSEASRARAEAAGMRPVEAAGLAAADLILSILPPAEALAFAARMAPVLAASAARPIYADCNAVSPETVRKVAAAIAPTGCRFVDAGIIGHPVKPVFYAAGEAAAAMRDMAAPPLDIRVMDGPVGTASALKLCYALVSKGGIALGAAVALLAARAGVAEWLKAEMAASLPALRAGYARSVPDMTAKARRWAPEMEEIAAFIGAELPESGILSAMAGFYDRVADGLEAADPAMTALRTFWTLPE